MPKKLESDGPDKANYKVFVYQGIPYLPHYKDASKWVGPCGKSYPKEAFMRADVRETVMHLWDRPFRLQAE